MGFKQYFFKLSFLLSHISSHRVKNRDLIFYYNFEIRKSKSMKALMTYLRSNFQLISLIELIL
jgi:hypothetical protein